MTAASRFDAAVAGLDSLPRRRVMFAMFAAQAGYWHDYLNRRHTALGQWLWDATREQRRRTGR